MFGRANGVAPRTGPLLLAAPVVTRPKTNQEASQKWLWWLGSSKDARALIAPRKHAGLIKGPRLSLGKITKNGQRSKMQCDFPKPRSFSALLWLLTNRLNRECKLNYETVKRF